MHRLRNIFLALTLAAGAATGAADAAVVAAKPAPRFHVEQLTAEVRDGLGRTWTFAPTTAALMKRGVYEL